MHTPSLLSVILSSLIVAKYRLLTMEIPYGQTRTATTHLQFTNKFNNWLPDWWISAGPRQHSDSWFRASRDSWSYFTLRRLCYLTTKIKIKVMLRATVSDQSLLGSSSIWSPRLSGSCGFADVGGRLWREDGTAIAIWVRVRVSVTLRLAVYRQSVHLGDKPHETHDH
jgi:hypothetical protein